MTTHLRLDDLRRAYAAALKAHNGVDVEAMGGFDLWVLDVTGASGLALGGPDHLRITIWKEGEEERAIKKH